MLAFLVPSATARAAAVIPIMLGVIAGVRRGGSSRFAGLLMITTVQAVSIWNVGIKTAAAQNMVAVGFIQKMLGHDITWLSWLVAAAPFSIVMSIGLYFIMMTMMPPEAKEIARRQATVDKALAELGPMTGAEKRLLTISLILLCFWATEGILHPFDSSTTTTIAVALLFLPGIGVMDWKQAQRADSLGHHRAVRRRHQPRHRAAADPGRAVAGQPDRAVVRAQQLRRAGDPGGDGGVPGRRSIWASPARPRSRRR